MALFPVNWSSIFAFAAYKHDETVNPYHNEGLRKSQEENLNSSQVISLSNSQDLSLSDSQELSLSYSHPHLLMLEQIKDYAHQIFGQQVIAEGSDSEDDNYTYYEAFKFRVSLGFSVFRINSGWKGTKHWNSILGQRLYLSALPLENYGHGKMIAEELKVTRILTLNKPFELVPTCIGSPVDWSLYPGVNQEIVPARDFVPLKQKHLDASLDFLIDCLESDQNGLAHCKAGVGRSAGVIIALIAIVFNITVIEALEYITHCRRITNLRPNQFESIKSYVELRGPEIAKTKGAALAKIQRTCSIYLQDYLAGLAKKQGSLAGSEVCQLVIRNEGDPAT